MLIEGDDLQKETVECQCDEYISVINCRLTYIADKLKTVAAACMLYRMVKMEEDLKNYHVKCADIVDITDDEIALSIYTLTVFKFLQKDNLTGFKSLLAKYLCLQEIVDMRFDNQQRVCKVKDVMTKRRFLDNEFISDKLAVQAMCEQRKNCYMYNVYYRAVFDSMIGCQLMQKCHMIEDEMIKFDSTTQCKVAVFDRLLDVAYIRLTVRALSPVDAARAAYERDTLIAATIDNVMDRNVVDDIAVCTEQFLLDDGLFTEKGFSLLNVDDVMVLPPYSFPVGSLQQCDSSIFGMHLLYRDYNRVDYQQCLLTAFGAPTYYPPKVLLTANTEHATGMRTYKDDGEKDFHIDKKKKAASSGEIYGKMFLKTLLSPVKYRRRHLRRRHRLDGLKILAYAGGLAVLGVAAGIMKIKEKIEDSKK